MLSQQSAARPGTPPNRGSFKPSPANPATANTAATANPTMATKNKAVIQPVLAAQANKPTVKPTPADSAHKTGNNQNVIQPFTKGAAKQNNATVNAP